MASALPVEGGTNKKVYEELWEWAQATVDGKDTSPWVELNSNLEGQGLKTALCGLGGGLWSGEKVHQPDLLGNQHCKNFSLSSSLHASQEIRELTAGSLRKIRLKQRHPANIR